MADTTTHRKTFLQGLAAVAAGFLLWPRKSEAAPARTADAVPTERERFPVEARKAPRAVEHRLS